MPPPGAAFQSPPVAWRDAQPILGRNAWHLKAVQALKTNMNQVMERLVPLERIVAVGLLTRHDLTTLGPAFDRAWPVEEAPSFSELLRAIDEADRRLCDEKEAPPRHH